MQTEEKLKKTFKELKKLKNQKKRFATSIQRVWTLDSSVSLFFWRCFSVVLQFSLVSCSFSMFLLLFCVKQMKSYTNQLFSQQVAAHLQQNMLFTIIMHAIQISPFLHTGVSRRFNIAPNRILGFLFNALHHCRKLSALEHCICCCDCSDNARKRAKIMLFVKEKWL